MVLGASLDLGVLHGLGRLVDIHHHGPLEVRHGAGERFQAGKMRPHGGG